MSMKIAVALLALVATLFAQAAHTDSAWAQPPQVLVEVIPSSVELPSKGEAQAVVVLRNSSTETLHDIRLSWFTVTAYCNAQQLTLDEAVKKAFE